MNKRIRIHNYLFEECITAEEIRQRVAALGRYIRHDYRDKTPVFLGILNGAFVFMADLIREANIPSTVSFIKLSSYKGFTSTGEVVFSGPLDPMLRGKDIIVVEDIIDSGKTMSAFLPALQGLQPQSIRICTLLLKPTMLQKPLAIDYVGFEIPPDFVIGYGLDYNELGRHLPSIYRKIS